MIDPEPSSSANASERPQRRLLLIHSLSGGGSERVAVELTRHWAATGHATALMTLASGRDDRYAPPPGVEQIALECAGESRGIVQAILSNRRRTGILREAVERFAPDVVVSFNDRTNVLAGIALRRRDFPLVVSERADPAMNSAGRMWSAIRRVVYPTVDSIVVLSEGYRAWANRVGRGVPVEVVPNACWSIAAEGESPPTDEMRESVVLSMGRLHEEKGFDRLIDAFARTAPDHPEWRLRIVGDGPLRESLRQRAIAAGIGDRFDLMPWTDDPRQYLRAARVFALPSRFEGFSNALVEALAAGNPAVAFRGSGGTEDVLRHEVDGLLVPADDVAGFGSALERLMGDDAFRAGCARHAIDACTRFSPDAAFAGWERAIAEATARRR